MLAVSFLQWWYSRGWGIYFLGFRDRLRNTADFFSIGLLLKTLFEPFRQISANERAANGGLDAALVAFFDRLLSRVIGFIVRVVVIIGGIVCLVGTLVIGLIISVLWPLIPLAPVAGIILCTMGVAF